MQIRNMTIADYEAVYALLRSEPGIGLNDFDDSREGVERYLRRNPATCFVALESRTLVGAIFSGHDGRRGYIGHTAVAPSARRQGVGRQLVESALAALRAEGIRKVALVAFADNPAGNAFWARCGFSARPDPVYRNRAIAEENVP